MKEPPRLLEALRHIETAGNLMPMQDVTVRQLDRIWDYIDGNALAVMMPAGTWQLTDGGREMLRERLTVLGSKDYEAFLEALNKPPKPNDRLKELMRTSPQWRTEKT